MKITTIEKQVLGVMAGLVVCIILSVKSCNDAIEKAGGITQVIVDAGIEIKDISEKIEQGSEVK